MPQPIRRACHLEFTGFTHRPLHAAVMGQIVGISGRLENALGWMLAIFSRGSAHITIAMFHAVVSTDAQRSMLLAAAEKSLGPAELNAFKELMEDFRPRYGERSKLIHNIWGHSNDHPDKAIWCRAADAGSAMAIISAITDPGKVGDAYRHADSELCLRCMAYTIQDLQDVASRLDEYTRRVSAFLFELLQAHPVLVAAATASTNAAPIGEEPQLDLHQPGQTGPQSEMPT